MDVVWVCVAAFRRSRVSSAHGRTMRRVFMFSECCGVLLFLKPFLEKTSLKCCPGGGHLVLLLAQNFGISRFDSCNSSCNSSVGREPLTPGLTGRHGRLRPAVGEFVKRSVRFPEEAFRSFKPPRLCLPESFIKGLFRQGGGIHDLPCHPRRVVPQQSGLNRTVDPG